MSDRLRLRLRLYAWLNGPPNREGVLLTASKPNCPEFRLGPVYMQKTYPKQKDHSPTRATLHIPLT